jgi:methylenetetrahydrofolate reductase (NADPH)
MVMMKKIPASIEISPKQAMESEDLGGLFPVGTRVYITDMGADSAETITASAKRMTDFGYSAVPHFASRRLTSRDLLENKIRMLSSEAGVTDVLIIGGGLQNQAGEFNSTMEVLETGLFDKYGIKNMGIAGHPEGSPDFDEAMVEQALKLKQAFAERTDAKMRIVTQFGFDSEGFIRWEKGLPTIGVHLPVHLGVAGPAKLTTLVKYAAMCGVGNSIQFLKKRGSAITSLLSGFDPDEVVNPIEQNFTDNPGSAIKQIHVFPFGGTRKSAEWLVERSSWVV